MTNTKTAIKQPLTLVRKTPAAYQEAFAFIDLGSDPCFGLCPVCHRGGFILKGGWSSDDPSLPGRTEDWLVCYDHKVRWFFGSGNFSCSKSEKELLKNGYRLLAFRIVDPYFPPCHSQRNTGSCANASSKTTTAPGPSPNGPNRNQNGINARLRIAQYARRASHAPN